jgi:hypothetical protein
MSAKGRTLERQESERPLDGEGLETRVNGCFRLRSALRDERLQLLRRRVRAQVILVLVIQSLRHPKGYIAQTARQGKSGFRASASTAEVASYGDVPPARRARSR